jgi:Protein of unknown function (DUF2637)
MASTSFTPDPTSAEPEARCGWGYAGAVLGGLVSIAANTAHSFVAPAGAPATWRPATGAVVGAVFWPIALFIAIEILARTAWPSGKGWAAVRFVGLLPVALVAAVVSYNHLSGLLAHYGEDRLTVTIGPLAVDGLMIMSSAAVMATAAKRRAAADSKRTQATDTVSARPVKRTDTRADSTSDTNADTKPDTVSAPKRTAKRTDGQADTGRRVSATRAKHPDWTTKQIAAHLDLTPRTVQRYPATAPTTETAPAAPVAEAVLATA